MGSAILCIKVPIVNFIDFFLLQVISKQILIEIFQITFESQKL